MARVLTALGVDFAILGAEERSDGDSARLAGESGLFEMLAEQNIKAFSKYEFKRLVVMDPHAYNAFKNHYPRLGWEGEVLHYTQFLAPLVDRIEWRSRVDLDVTYHDPCYLGSQQRRVRRAAHAPRGDPRDPAGGDAPHPGERLLLRRRRGRDVARRASSPTTSRSGCPSAASGRRSRPSAWTGRASCRSPARTSRRASRTPSSRPATTDGSSSATSSS